jgi:hypothetical protein
LQCAAVFVQSLNSGKSHRFQRNHGGTRQATAALYRVQLSDCAGHTPTLACAKKLTTHKKAGSFVA